jgi:hypothetical protein
MEAEGRDFAEVLGEAQALGYAEADPSFDIDGVDAAHKLAILSSLAFGTEVDFGAVAITGIRHVLAADIAEAAALGFRVRLVGFGEANSKGLFQRVHPCLVPLGHPLAHVTGSLNAVVAEGNFVGRLLFQGRGAGEGPTASAVVADLIDIVSKNGNLLLNVGPKSDGTIPDEIVSVLKGMGGWLKVNGEAIYGTRPFKYFGEGPTKSGQVRVGGQVEQSAVKGFTPADIRLTTKGNMVYALGLARPADGKVLIKTLYAGTPYLDAPIKNIELLDGGKISWQQTPQGLRVTLPPAADGSFPYALRIRTH